MYTMCGRNHQPQGSSLRAITALPYQWSIAVHTYVLEILSQAMKRLLIEEDMSPEEAEQ